MQLGNFLIFNSYADVSLTSTHQRGSGGRGNRQIGGLVGRNIFSDIHNSYSAGSVEALGRIGGTVGGLVGYGLKQKISITTLGPKSKQPQTTSLPAVWSDS